MMVATEVDNDGLAFNAAKEAYAVSAYMDTDHWAVAFGYNGAEVGPETVMELEEGIPHYLEKAKEYDSFVSKIFGALPIAQPQRNALFSACWNAGPTVLKDDTNLYRDVRDWLGQPTSLVFRDAVIHSFLAIRQDPQTGLYFNPVRRTQEAALFLTGQYGDISRLMYWAKGLNPKRRPVRDPFAWIAMPKFKEAKP